MQHMEHAASPTSGVFIAGGKYPAGSNVIDYVQIMSTGNAIDFGDLLILRTIRCIWLF